MPFERTASVQAHADPRLLADIGATYARFCVELVPGRFEHVAVLPCADYPGFTAVVQAYLDTLPGLKPRHGAVAIANPIEGDWVRMTNRDWAFSIQEAQRQLDLTTLLVVNNFTALAMSLPRVGADGRHQVGGGEAQANGVIGLIGPGTGLGVSSLIPSGDRWVTLATEGGHVGVLPRVAAEHARHHVGRAEQQQRQPRQPLCGALGDEGRGRRVQRRRAFGAGQ